MKTAVLWLLLVPLSSYALDPQETPRRESLSLEEIMNGLNRNPEPSVDCFDPQVTPNCTDINQQYCRNLAASGGRMTDASGTVNVGQSARSQLSQLERAGLDDLVRAHARLPQDLKRELERPIRDLSTHLQRENDSRGWYRDLARIRNRIADKIKDVSRDRATASLRQRFPRGTRPTRADVDAERDAQERNLNEIVTRARMESSPNWSRLNSIFDNVKRDMLNVINTLPLTQEEKNARIERINRTTLSHPFGVRVGGVVGQIIENDCRHNMVNAMYMTLNGTLTVCAGFVNGYQSENALYFTLAHELAHAFNLKDIQSTDSQPRAKQLNERLLATNGNMNCAEFNRMKAELPARTDNWQCGRETYTNFMNCLNGNHQHSPEKLGQRNMGVVAQIIMNLDVCSIADRRSGLAYMNPNEFSDRNFARLTNGALQEYTGPAIPGARGLMSPVYRLTQELRCAPQGTACQEVLANSVESMITEISPPPACLAASEAGSENEADWYAHKAMILRLRNVTDLRERRQMVASSMGLFCGYQYMRPLSDRDQERLIQELSKVQGGMDEDNHSDNSTRLNGVMTEEMAGLLQCNNPSSNPAQNYQSCRL